MRNGTSASNMRCHYCIKNIMSVSKNGLVLCSSLTGAQWWNEADVLFSVGTRERPDFVFGHSLSEKGHRAVLGCYSHKSCERVQELIVWLKECRSWLFDWKSAGAECLMSFSLLDSCVLHIMLECLSCWSMLYCVFCLGWSTCFPPLLFLCQTYDALVSTN